MLDNAPCHASKATIKCLEALVLKTKRYWFGRDINPVENLWVIIKQRVYADVDQFSTLHELWKAIELEFAVIPCTFTCKKNLQFL